MGEFEYTGRTADGEVVQGTVEAMNSAVAAGKIHAMGIEVERIRPVFPHVPVEPKARAMADAAFGAAPLPELAQFFRNLATLVGAGLTTGHALGVLDRQISNPRLQAVARALAISVTNGAPLSVGLDAYPGVFTPLQREMVRVSEHGGFLDETLPRIADYIESEIAFRRMISRLTLYPKIVAFCAVMILGLSFATEGMPVIAKLVLGTIGLGGYLLDTVIGPAAVAGLVYGVVAGVRAWFARSPEGRGRYEALKLTIPWFGSLIRSLATARFARALGAAYRAGVPAGAALRLAGLACANAGLAAAADQAALEAEQGVSMANALASAGAFPSVAIAMLHSGEQTGSIDVMMEKVAEYLESESSARAHTAAQVFSTGLYILVAISVGMAIIRFYGGIIGQMGAAAG